MKKIGMLMAMAAMMGESTMSQDAYMVTPTRPTPPRGYLPKVNKRYGATIQIEYPDHYTNQQRGFTPAGSAKLHFNKMRDWKKAIHTV